MISNLRTVMGYQPMHRVDEGDRAWTFLAVHRETGRHAALKIHNPSHFSAATAAEAWLQPQHTAIPRIIRSGLRGETGFVLRDWAPGVTFEELVARPPSRENTRRMCTAILRLCEVLEWLHADGDTYEEAARVHGRVDARNVIVAEGGRVALINAEGCRIAAPRPPGGFADDEGPIIEPRPAPLRDLRPNEVRAAKTLFDSMWGNFGKEVVPLDAAVPRELAALRARDYTQIEAFRRDLSEALAASSAF